MLGANGLPRDLSDEASLERLLALADGEAASDEAEDDVPEPPEEPVSRPGDLWVLGNHRVLCGDATVLADVERVLGGQLADMTFCDPPYNVDYANSPKDKLRGKHRPILNDDLGGGFEEFCVTFCVDHPVREPGHGGCREHHAHGDRRDVEGLANAGDDGRRQDGIAAEREERVRHTDAVDPGAASDLTRSGAAMLTTGDDLRACARLWRLGELDRAGPDRGLFGSDRRVGNTSDGIRR